MLVDPEHAPTVVMITHHVEELPPATSQILLLDQGTVAGVGSPEEVLTNESLMRVYRCPLEVRHEEDRYYVRVSPAAWKALI